MPIPLWHRRVVEALGNERAIADAEVNATRAHMAIGTYITIFFPLNAPSRSGIYWITCGL